MDVLTACTLFCLQKYVSYLLIHRSQWCVTKGIQWLYLGLELNGETVTCSRLVKLSWLVWGGKINIEQQFISFLRWWQIQVQHIMGNQKQMTHLNRTWKTSWMMDRTWQMYIILYKVDPPIRSWHPLSREHPLVTLEHSLVLLALSLCLLVCVYFFVLLIIFKIPFSVHYIANISIAEMHIWPLLESIGMIFNWSYQLFYYSLHTQALYKQFKTLKKKRWIFKSRLLKMLKEICRFHWNRE